MLGRGSQQRNLPAIVVAPARCRAGVIFAANPDVDRCTVPLLRIFQSKLTRRKQPSHETRFWQSMGSMKAICPGADVRACLSQSTHVLLMLCEPKHGKKLKHTSSYLIVSRNPSHQSRLQAREG